MKAIFIAGAFAVLALAGCTTTPQNTVDDNGVIRVAELPEGVVSIVGPNQDTSVVVIMPEDGCYWYLYAGPVESTYLPLLTSAGRMICTRENDPVLGAQSIT